MWPMPPAYGRRPAGRSPQTRAEALTPMGDGGRTGLQQRGGSPDHSVVTTAPVMGQPAAAFPAAPRVGRAGLLAVPALVVAIAAVVVAVAAVPGSTLLGVLVGLAGLTVLLASQGLLWRRQRQLTGYLQRSQSSFRTLVKSSVDPVVILDGDLRITFASESVAELMGVDPACV